MNNKPTGLIIGAGVIGASCAFHLASRGAQVTVIEQFGSAAEGSTGRSFASVRGQWSDELNIQLSWRSIQTYRDFESIYGTDVGYRPTGYMYLIHEEDWEQALANVQFQRNHGVPVQAIDIASAQSKTPFEPEGLAGCTWGEADGVVDPYLATNTYLQLAKSQGAKIYFNETVCEINKTDLGWRVATANQTFSGEFILNCAGGWASEIASLAGFEVPVKHFRRNIYSTAAKATPTHPMTIDPRTGVFMRSEGDRLLFGLSRADEPAGYNTSVDWDWMETVLERASDRFPWLLEVPIDTSGAWAGTYEITPDHFPILGALPENQSWINCCGFSGHGVMQAPYIGELMAEEIIDSGCHSLDISALRIDRLRDGTARIESMVL